jgi:hypothetical protein
MADVVYVLFAEKGTKTMSVVKHVRKTGVPIFTCQYDDDPATDVNKELFALGIPSYRRKTVGKYLEALGATVNAPPPFPLEAPDLPAAPLMPVNRRPRPRQTSFL